MESSDVLSYLNSRDEREYLESIGYEFGTLEAMWLTWRKRNIPVAERQEAWRDILATMPDCAIGERNNVRARESAHAFMREVMAAEGLLLDAFATDEPDVVYCTVPYECSLRTKYLYASLGECLADVEDTWMNDEDEVVSVVKKWLRGGRETVSVLYSRALEPLAVEACGDRFEEQRELLDEVEGFAFDIPAPFKRGDLVRCATDGCLGNCRDAFIGPQGPFVITSIVTEREDKERYFAHADSCDMTAHGLWQREDGRFYWEVMHSYIDLEYVREEPTGKLRALNALGALMRGEIEPELFIDVYDAALAQECADMLAQAMRYEYLGEVLKGLGWGEEIKDTSRKSSVPV